MELVGQEYGSMMSDAYYRKYIRPKQQATNCLAKLIFDYIEEVNKRVQLEFKVLELERELEKYRKDSKENEQTRF